EFDAIAMVPKYLATFRRAVRDPDGCEKSDLSEKRLGLNSLNSLNSRLRASEKPFTRVFKALEARCPDHIELGSCQQAVVDGRTFLATWREQADALDWTARDVFGLHRVPAKPAPNYPRLSRYDETGLIWLLRGRPVVALTANTAAIENPTGTVTIYRKNNKPAAVVLGLEPPDIGEQP